MVGNGVLTSRCKQCILCALIENDSRVDREGTSKGAIQFPESKRRRMFEPGGLRKEKQSWRDEKEGKQESWATCRVCR